MPNNVATAKLVSRADVEAILALQTETLGNGLIEIEDGLLLDEALAHPGKGDAISRLDEPAQEVLNRDVAEGVTLDIGADERIVGIEILDASRRLDLRQVLPVSHGTAVA